MSKDNEINIEAIAESIHHIYCQYHSEVLGTEYWTKGNYDLLDEETKEADRYIARFFRDLIGSNVHILPDRYVKHQARVLSDEASECGHTAKPKGTRCYPSLTETFRSAPSPVFSDGEIADDGHIAN